MTSHINRRVLCAAMPISLRALLAVMLAVPLLLTAHRLAAQPADEDVRLACDQAAAQAERAASLPPGLLAAIGTVESGRPDTSGLYRRAWPWSINADGAGYFASTKTEAISLVHTLQARGARYIDVGCFQVDLFYHPGAFSSLDEAFDPDANARAAAHILMQARFASTAWNQAIAAYHSASLLQGTWYLQRVLEAWTGEHTRTAGTRHEPRREARLRHPALSERQAGARDHCVRPANAARWIAARHLAVQCAGTDAPD